MHTWTATMSQGSEAAASRRLPPWVAADMQRPSLDLCRVVFGPWLRSPPFAAVGMRPSKFERRVLDILVSFGVQRASVVREVVLPVRVDHALRRYLDDPVGGEFQRADEIALRLDFVCLDPADRRALLIIEVDGRQHHAGESHFFFSATSHSRAMKRDLLKTRLIRDAEARVAAGLGSLDAPTAVRFLRIGPEFERDTTAAKTELTRLLMAFFRPEYAKRLGISSIAACSPGSSPKEVEVVPLAPRGGSFAIPVGAASSEAAGAASGEAEGAESGEAEGEESGEAEGEESGEAAGAASGEAAAMFEPDKGGNGRTPSAAKGTARRRRFARSASAPSELPRPSLPMGVRRYMEEERLRKLRTVYNRMCKAMTTDPAELERIRRRQQASDSRKRARDDTGAPYEPKWFRHAHEEAGGAPSEAPKGPRRNAAKELGASESAEKRITAGVAKELAYTCSSAKHRVTQSS